MSADPFPGLAAFVRAAEARSFTAAARLLGVTPSAISKAVSRLEAELGVRLFNRGRREVVLTGDGEDFFRQCRHLVHAAEDARAGLAGGGREARGTLRACVPISFGQYVVGPALSGWLARHPGVKVELMLTDRYADLGEERLDLAMRLGEVPDSRLVARAMPPHRFVTCAAPAYLDRHGTPTSPADLARHNCLAYFAATTGAARAWHFMRDGEAVKVRPEGRFITDQAALLVALAEQGCGIVQAPRYLVRDALDGGRLRPLLAEYATVGPPLSIVYPQARHPALRVRLFVDFLLGLGDRL